MPAIQNAASTGPAAATAAAAPPAADGAQGAGPFAALLQQQLADPATAGTALAPELQLLAAADEAAQTPSLDALLPLLLGAKGLSNGLPAQAQEPAKPDAEDPATVALDLLLALPTTIPGAAIAQSPASGAPTSGNAGIDLGAQLPDARSGSASAANAAAILAAAPDAAAAAGTEGQDSFDALLGGHDSPATAAAATTAHAGAATGSSAAAQATGAAPMRIETPVGAPGWDRELGNHVTWMAGRLENRAELVLTPPQLGRIEISLSVTGDQASAVFTSANPAVREALESALPRLREILADAGIQLGQAQVGSEAPGQSAQGWENGDNPRRDPNAGTAGAQAFAPVAGSAPNPWASTGRGMVDVFA